MTVPGIGNMMPIIGKPSSNPWDVSGAVYELSKTFNVQYYNLDNGIFFSVDGTKVYILDAFERLTQHNLSSAWDISTAGNYVSQKNLSGYGSESTDIHFKPDGTKMYMASKTNTRIYQFSLSTAWALSTLSYDSIYYSLTNPNTDSVSGLFFKPDGTEAYVADHSGYKIRQYSLSTAWDLSTMTYTREKTGIAAPYNIKFSSDGTMAFVSNFFDSAIRYSLSTAWDISTMTYVSKYHISNTYSRALFFKPDGTKMYVSKDGTKIMEQYKL